RLLLRHESPFAIEHCQNRRAGRRRMNLRLA
ncbi:MAG: hypothetical protein ACI92S_000018, partial [Planctomycetaceae bacterium]